MLKKEKAKHKLPENKVDDLIELEDVTPDDEIIKKEKGGEGEKAKQEGEDRKESKEEVKKDEPDKNQGN